MKAFAEAISKGALNNLENLNLKNNKIGNEGMEAFAEALSKGVLNKLTHLNLYGNKIGDEGMKAFAKALSKGPPWIEPPKMPSFPRCQYCSN